MRLSLLHKRPLWALIGVFTCFCLYWYLPRYIEQANYESFFRSKDICFQLDIEGSADYRWYSAIRCSTGEELGVLYGTSTATLRFLDIEDDGIPEIYIRGNNPAFPQSNFYRYDAGAEFPFSVIEDLPVDTRARIMRIWG
jgi:hypothetical protein